MAGCHRIQYANPPTVFVGRVDMMSKNTPRGVGVQPQQDTLPAALHCSIPRNRRDGAAVHSDIRYADRGDVMGVYKQSLRLVGGSLWLAAGIGLGAFLVDQVGKPAIDTMLDSSVAIRTITHVKIDQLGDSVWSKRHGSGFFVSAENCEVWTNHHVVAEAALIEIIPRDWSAPEGIAARVISSDPHTDIAVLRMTHCTGMKAAEFGDSDTLQTGDEVFAVGNPFGRNPDSISRGIVSHKHRYLRGGVEYLQSDAMINTGNSGGALFDRRGRVIGVNTAVATDNSSGGTGVSYSVPINNALRAVERLHTGTPSWGDIGLGDLLTELAPTEAEMFRIPAGRPAVTLISDPQKGSALGLLKARDAIFEINGIPLRGLAHLEWLVSNSRPGSKLDVQFMRNGIAERTRIAVENGWNVEPPPSPEHYDGYLGMKLANWSGEEDEKSNFKSPVILHVTSLGPAHRAGVLSSQHQFYRQGPFLQSYLMEVRAITGIIVDGRYEPLASPDDLNAVAEVALSSGAAILLEVEEWQREPKNQAEAPFRHVGTTYHRVQPAASIPASGRFASAL